MAVYTCLWEYVIRPDAEAEFLRHYGPEGTWVQLFRSAPGYLDTRLLRDNGAPHRFVTVDRWTSSEAYRAFRSLFSARYEALDRACAALTLSEKAIGGFEEV
jgi:heme-degrading monooxygenase HmoA